MMGLKYPIRSMISRRCMMVGVRMIFRCFMISLPNRRTCAIGHFAFSVQVAVPYGVAVNKMDIRAPVEISAEGFNEVGTINIVAVQVGDVLPASGFQSVVSRIVDDTLTMELFQVVGGPLDVMDTAVIEPLDDFGRVIGGSVVDDDQFKIGTALPKHAAD